MKDEKHDELWELLGKAREPKAAPFFASKVLRAIHAEAEAVSFWTWLRGKWLVPVATGACAALALFLTTHQAVQTAVPLVNDPLAEMAAVVVDNDESVSALDALIAAEDHSIWLESDLSSLF